MNVIIKNMTKKKTNKKWTIKKECGDNNNNISKEDVKDIFYRFFLTDRFQAGDAFEITTPEDVYIEFPTIDIPWTSIWSGKRKNTDFIVDKSLLTSLTKSENSTDKTKKLLDFWEKWFYCFGHPLIYLQYERLVLDTEQEYRYSEKKYRESIDEQEDVITNKTDRILEIIYKTNFKLFCKMRTKFIKCYGETIKPAHFCSGLYSKIPPEHEKNILDTVEKLGYPHVRDDMKKFSGNSDIHHSMYLSRKRKQEKEKKENTMSRKEKIAAHKKELSKLQHNENLEREIEEQLDFEEESPDFDEYEQDEQDEEYQEDEQDEQDEQDENRESKFGARRRSKYGLARRKAIKATANVLSKWKQGKRGDAVKLFKMYEAVVFKRAGLENFHNVMLKSRRLF